MHNGDMRRREKEIDTKSIKTKCMKVAQSCPTLCNPMDYTVPGVLQARILEWVSLSLLQGIFPTPDAGENSVRRDEEKVT